MIRHHMTIGQVLREIGWPELLTSNCGPPSEEEAIMTGQVWWAAPPTKDPKARSSQVCGSAQARSDPAKDRVAPPLRCLLRLMHGVIVRPLTTAAQRRKLALLSDRQLRDAGIDLALAGRGKAVAVDRSTLARLLTLSQG